YDFLQGDIGEADAIEAGVSDFDPDAVLHLAAESHVDRSIDDPRAFIDTNVSGTFVLLEAALRHWSRLGSARQARFLFVHVSTDEVFGTLPGDGRFDLKTPYGPSSPYAASQ